MNQLIKQEPHFGILSLENKVPPYQYKPLILPPKVHPYEEYRFITHLTVPNIMPERYLISNYGNTWDRALDHPIPTKLNSAENGYVQFKVAYYEDWDKLSVKDVYVHRAIMITFAPIPNYQNMQVNHKNGNKLENIYPDNLEWVTAKENVRHALQTGLMGSGVSSTVAVLNSDQVHEICRRLCENESLVSIADKMGIPVYLVQSIKSKNSYTDISKFYPIPNVSTISKGLPDEIVHRICRDLANGAGNQEIMNRYHIPRHVLSDIKFRRNYIHISNNYTFPEYKKQIAYSDEDIHKVCKLLSEGLSASEVSKITGVKNATVQQIQRGKAKKAIASQYDIKPAKKYQKLDEGDAAAIIKLLINHPEMNNFEIANLINCKHNHVRDIRTGKYFTELAEKLGYTPI